MPSERSTTSVNSRSALPPPTKANELVLDDQQLARRARTTLAGADAGLLLTGDRPGRPRLAVPVRVFDDGGEALIRCEQSSAVAFAARARRLAALVLAPNPIFGVRLTLSGRLSPAERTGVRAADVVVALSVDAVRVGCPHGHWGRPTAEGRSVPISLYAMAEPDILAANIPRVIRLVNDEHAEQVRWLAAHATGVPLHRLAAATLTGLSAHGAVLCWIDEHGAHHAELPFARPAHTLEDLAATLRACVSAARAAR